MIGNKIRKYRLAKGMTQEALGERITLNGKPVSGKTVWSWETGRTEPNMGAVQQLADIFGIRMDSLISDDEDAQDQKILPNFRTAEEAVRFILELPLVADFGGYDLSKMTDDQKIGFATEVAKMISVMGDRYPRKE